MDPALPGLKGELGSGLLEEATFSTRLVKSSLRVPGVEPELEAGAALARAIRAASLTKELIMVVEKGQKTVFGWFSSGELGLVIYHGDSRSVRALSDRVIRV